MKLWSPRLETNASVLPSGDQDGDPLVPRSANAASAFFEPSMGARKIFRSCVNATRVLSGEMAGESPSPSSVAGPPAVAIAHTCIFGAVGLAAGFGASPGRVAPWSPPRTYTIVLPFLANDRLVSS